MSQGALSTPIRPAARWRVLGLLSAPLAWLVIIYLGSLGVMLATAWYSVDSFTGALIKEPSGSNFQVLLTSEVYRTVALRTLGVAVTVTLIDAALALPIGLYLAKIARPRARAWLLIAVLTPLWASYLVKVYAWRSVLGGNGIADWLLAPLGLKSPGYGLVATTLVLAYLWLPYMIMPIYAALERMPDSLIDASSDLGASPWRTFRAVILPMIYPAVIAGSVFTFSLSLGDYITVKIVGGTTQLFANIIYDNIGVAGNLPFAAAASFFPVAVVVLYLAVVRRTGALENL